MDNREWLANPCDPAIIVGTIDMIGSRLLFEGYGVSRKMRPLHAGMLGVDSLLILDEAHLVPPFEALLEHLSTLRADGAGSKQEAIPNFRLLTLSATGRKKKDSFTISEEDLRPSSLAYKRLNASKRLSLVDHLMGQTPEMPLDHFMAQAAWELVEATRRRA